MSEWSMHVNSTTQKYGILQLLSHFLSCEK